MTALITQPRSLIIPQRGHRKPARPLLDPTHPLSRGLVGCWPLGKNIRGIEPDISVNRNDAAIFDGSLPLTLFPSHHGGASSGLSPTFTQYIALPNVALLNTLLCPLTIVAWVYQISNTGVQAVYGIYDQFAAHHLGSLVRIDSGVLKYYTTEVSPTFFQGIGSLTITSGVWTFIAVVIGGTAAAPTGSLFANFASESPSLNALDTIASGIQPFIGADAGGGLGAVEFFNGAIEGLRIYNRALSNSEIRRLYAEPYAGIYEANPTFRVGAAAAGGFLAAPFERHYRAGRA